MSDLGMAQRKRFLRHCAADEAMAKVAQAADAYLWDRNAETDKALVDAVAAWRSAVGRWKLADHELQQTRSKTQVGHDHA